MANFSKLYRKISSGSFVDTFLYVDLKKSNRYFNNYLYCIQVHDNNVAHMFSDVYHFFNQNQITNLLQIMDALLLMVFKNDGKWRTFNLTGNYLYLIQLFSNNS